MPRKTKMPTGVRSMSGYRVTGWPRKVMLAVACPRCHAAKGWICTTALGKDSTTAHAARYEAYAALDSGANLG